MQVAAPYWNSRTNSLWHHRPWRRLFGWSLIDKYEVHCPLRGPEMSSFSKFLCSQCGENTKKKKKRSEIREVAQTSMYTDFFAWKFKNGTFTHFLLYQLTYDGEIDNKSSQKNIIYQSKFWVSFTLVSLLLRKKKKKAGLKQWVSLFNLESYVSGFLTPPRLHHHQDQSVAAAEEYNQPKRSSFSSLYKSLSKTTARSFFEERPSLQYHIRPRSCSVHYYKRQNIQFLNWCKSQALQHHQNIMPYDKPF